ncbi:ATP-binding protein [Labedaea rhizosphaerae]|uniref:Anti-sigma regulatory factor (Ser/Thr protein kinase) n=1 Tax=Labedaea rhizosphaerae TaxID=598644 RepID=A0A4R6SEB2_LABRH|nr:ATP-binding protein [Labedaea rhizosphaerae]TDQ00232.1 anti-sigma regulatory factor (Ser/Thr protein kinase) [Labedaea rhizosphaerae]
MTTKRSEEDVTSTPEELHCRVEADANRLAAVRKALSGWAEDLGMTREQRSDLVLAAYEALANAAEHAYVGRTDGVIDLSARCTQGTITIVVTDYGTWRAPQPSDGLRGRGLLLINALTRHHQVTHGDNGTTVTMTWPTPGSG